MGSNYAIIGFIMRERGVSTVTIERREISEIEELSVQLATARQAYAERMYRRMGRTGDSDKRAEVDELTQAAYEQARTAYGKASLEDELAQAHTDTEKNRVVVQYLIGEEQKLNQEIFNPEQITVRQKIRRTGRHALKALGNWMSKGSKKAQFAKGAGVGVAASAAIGAAGGAAVLGGAVAAFGMAGVRYIRGLSTGMAVDALQQTSSESEISEQLDAEDPASHDTVHSAFLRASEIMNAEREQNIKSIQNRNMAAHKRGVKVMALGAFVGGTVAGILTVGEEAYAATIGDSAHETAGTIQVESSHEAAPSLFVAEGHETSGVIDVVDTHEAASVVDSSASHVPHGAVEVTDTHEVASTVNVSGSHEVSGVVDIESAHEASDEITVPAGSVEVADESSHDTNSVIDATGTHSTATGIDVENYHVPHGVIDVSDGHEVATTLDIPHGHEPPHGAVEVADTHEVAGTIDVSNSHEISGTISITDTHEPAAGIDLPHTDPGEHIAEPVIESSFVVQHGSSHTQELVDAAHDAGQEITPEQAYAGHMEIVDTLGTNDYINLDDFHGPDTYSMGDSVYEVGISAPSEDASWTSEATPLVEDLIDDGEINGSVEDVSTLSEKDWRAIESMLERAADSDQLDVVSERGTEFMNELGPQLKDLVYADGTHVAEMNANGSWSLVDSDHPLPQQALDTIHQFMSENEAAEKAARQLARVL